MMTLQGEIEDGRKTVKADAYSMSIGEIANLYRDGEIVIRPEFQRLFRWSIGQKSRLIESILLGIPIPSIFVMQRNDSVWEVIDGLQRLSTILEFMGELRDEQKEEILPASVLRATKYLPSLEGISFESDGKKVYSLTPSQRISFKRSKLDLKILLPESDQTAKFELFDRLNTGGAAPSDQEIRNCLLIMQDKKMYDWLVKCQSNSNFASTLSITERLVKQQYDLELVCRFLALHNTRNEDLKDMESVDSFLTDKMLSFSRDSQFNRASQARTFSLVFELLAEALGSDAFRRYDPQKERFLGGFSVSAYDAITAGISANISEWQKLDSDRSADLIIDRIMELWSEAKFRTQARAGVRGTTRIAAVVPFARKMMRP